MSKHPEESRREVHEAHKRLEGRIQEIRIKTRNRFVEFNLSQIEESISGAHFLPTEIPRFETKLDQCEQNLQEDERSLTAKFLKQSKGSPKEDLKHLTESLYCFKVSNPLIYLKTIYHVGDMLKEKWYRQHSVSPAQTVLQKYIDRLINVEQNLTSLSFPSLWDGARCVQKVEQHLKVNYSDEESKKGIKRNKEYAAEVAKELVGLALRHDPRILKAIVLGGSLGRCSERNAVYNPQSDIDIIVITDSQDTSARYNLVMALYSRMSAVKKEKNIKLCCGGPKEISGIPSWMYLKPSWIKNRLENMYPRAQPTYQSAEFAYNNFRFRNKEDSILYECEPGWVEAFEKEVVYPYDSSAKKVLEKRFEFVKK